MRNAGDKTFNRFKVLPRRIEKVNISFETSKGVLLGWREDQIKLVFNKINELIEAINILNGKEGQNECE